MIKPKVLGWILCLKVVTAVYVNISDGTIEGITDTTRNGTQYYGFLAVRYGEPPVGNLRLKPSQPVKPWQGVYDGTAEKNVCHQVYQDTAKENEDCLFLNVFTPKNLESFPVTADLTVMVWIHGGGFISGAAYMIEGGVGPKFFMDRNIVFVSINYRLGPFGFMSSGDETIPGNFGLKDQVLALKWVQKNIAYFGGDPDKVTIFGQSAGSASVSYQLLSPLSQGLFRGAILESGSALSPWAYQRNETNITFKLAQKIDPGFNSTNSSDLLTFLQSVPAASIDNASRDLSAELESPADYQISKGFFFAPVIEAPDDNAFLTERQYGLFDEGNYNKVPILLGMTNEESLGLLDNGDLSAIWKAYDAQPEILVPYDMHITDVDLKRTIGAEIKQNFGGDDGFSIGNDAKGIKYHSVHDFDKANIKQAELMSTHSTVYFYEFSYHGKMGYFNYTVPGAGNVTHAEEVNYFFSKWYSTEIPDNTDMSYFPIADQNVHYRIMALWTDFAKYLNPTPPGIDEDVLQHVTWEPVTSDEFRYLDIGEDLVMKSGYPKNESYIFWKNLYENYAILPLDTF